MRMPINRGFPVLAPRRGALELFRPPEDTDLFYRLTAFAHPLTEVQVSVQRRIAAGYTAADGFSDAVSLADVVLPVSDASRRVLFREYPMSRRDLGVYLSEPNPSGIATPRYCVFAHVDVDDLDTREPNRALVTERPQAPFTIPFLRPLEGQQDITLHTLVAGQIDLVSLKVLLPAGMEITLKFFDGTYRNGQPQFTALPMRNFNEEIFQDSAVIPGEMVERVLFDRHPMRGPGAIRAVVKTGAQSIAESGLFTGAVYR